VTKKRTPAAARRKAKRAKAAAPVNLEAIIASLKADFAGQWLAFARFCIPRRDAAPSVIVPVTPSVARPRRTRCFSCGWKDQICSPPPGGRCVDAKACEAHRRENAAAYRRAELELAGLELRPKSKGAS
jgi:hypothetical protein